jgi:hypothetical protein
MTDLNPTGVIALLGGIVLLYAGIKNKYPQDVIREALGKKALKGPIYVPPATVDGNGTTHQLAPITPTANSGVPVVSV